MPYKSECRSLTIGQEMNGIGRWARLVPGLLALAYIAATVSQATLSPILLGQLAGGILLTATLYMILFLALSEWVLAHLHPWVRTGIFWAPFASIPFLFLIPWGWGFGALAYVSLGWIVGALTSYGGCEVIALPSLLFRRRYVAYCPLNAIDLVESKYVKR